MSSDRSSILKSLLNRARRRIAAQERKNLNLDEYEFLDVHQILLDIWNDIATFKTNHPNNIKELEDFKNSYSKLKTRFDNIKKTLDDSNLKKINLSGADLSQASCINTNFENANMNGVKLPHYTKMKGANISLEQLASVTLDDNAKTLLFNRVYKALYDAQTKNLAKSLRKEVLNDAKAIQKYVDNNPNSRSAEAWKLTNAFVKHIKYNRKETILTLFNNTQAYAAKHSGFFSKTKMPVKKHIEDKGLDKTDLDVIALGLEKDSRSDIVYRTLNGKR